MIVIKKVIEIQTYVYNVAANSQDQAIRLSTDAQSDSRLAGKKVERDIKFDFFE